MLDVVGIVTGISDIVSIDVKGPPTFKRTLRLTDTRETATVALWSQNAQAIDPQMWIDVSSREPVVALVMGCTYKKQNSMLELSASFGSQVCVNGEVPEITALRDRLVGSAHPIELMVERGRRFQSDQIEVSTVAELAEMNPHIAMGKKFRSKIVIDGLQPNQGWWFLPCDDCSWKAVEEGPMYRCTNERCSQKSASPRYRLPVVASENGSSVAMVFFGDIARDLIGKDADVLLAENYSLVSTVPSEINTLSGKCYVVDVAVSRYSFRSMDICFQVLKFYPEGSTVFVDHASALLSVGKTNVSLLGSTVGAVEKGSASGSVNIEDEPNIRTIDVNDPASTPPPVLAKETPQKGLSGLDEENDPDQVDGAMSRSIQQMKKSGSTTKRQLYTESGGKSAKKHQSAK